MQVMDRAEMLAQDIRESEEYHSFARFRDELKDDEAAMALIRECQRLQTAAQICAMSGRQMEANDMQRMTSIMGLLYADPRTSGYLMSQMQLQKLMADVIALLSKAAELPIDLPS